MDSVVLRGEKAGAIERLQYWPFLFKMDLDEFKGMDADGIKYLKGCTHLRVFKFTGPYFHPLIDLSDVLKEFPSLVELELGSVWSSDKLVKAISNFTQLTKLSIDLSNSFFILDVGKLTHLQELSISGSTNIEGVKALSRLQALRLQNSKGSDKETIAATTSLVSLEVFELTQGNSLIPVATSAIEQALPQLTNLKALTLEIEPITAEMHGAISTLTKLESVRLNGPKLEWNVFKHNKNPYDLPNLLFYENNCKSSLERRIYQKK